MAISKKRKKFLKKITEDIKGNFYPDGNVPDNFRAKMWTDPETNELVIIEVTNNPELWDLPNYSPTPPTRFIPTQFTQGVYL